MKLHLRLVLFALMSSVAAWAAQTLPCEPAPDIRAEIEKATAVPVSDLVAFDQNIAPFLALRDRHPTDLLVHERYQDAVQQHGIEGHLRTLTQEYQNLYLEHASDLTYHYLFARTMIGRSTPSAIRNMTEILAQNPDFAPAHRSLAEIYGSEAFHDVEKERVEREKFLALCPGSALARGRGALPDPSPLVDRAERLLAENGDPDKIADMAIRGVRDDEWRLQRLRPFDWYSVDYKRQSQRQLRAEYWRVWSIQVRCYRKARKPEKAAELLATLEQRARLLRNQSEPVSWDALAILVRLYAEGNQKEQAMQKLDSMRQFLVEHPDSDHASQLEDLRRQITRAGG